MKYLILTTDDDETFYDLDAVASIEFGLAAELLNESDIQGNGYKTLETVMVIYFIDGSSASYSAAGCKISFD